MNKFKKIISLALIASQIGCANHVVHSSLSNAQFDPNYSYTIKTNQNVIFPNVPGASIQNLSDRVYVTENGQTKYLLHNQITGIVGDSYKTTGSHAADGFLIGGTIGALAGGIAFYGFSTMDSDCYGYEDECQASAIMGLAVFGGIGAGIGAAIPKKSQIQVTPTFSSSSNKMGAGANLSVRF